MSDSLLFESKIHFFVHCCICDLRKNVSLYLCVYNLGIVDNLLWQKLPSFLKVPGQSDFFSYILYHHCVCLLIVKTRKKYLVFPLIIHVCVYCVVIVFIFATYFCTFSNLHIVNLSALGHACSFPYNVHHTDINHLFTFLRCTMIGQSFIYILYRIFSSLFKCMEFFTKM